MPRFHSRLWWIVFAAVLGAGSIPSMGFGQEGIVVEPPNPTELDSIAIIITAWCCYSPVVIRQTDLALAEGRITVTDDRQCGDATAPRLYTNTVLLAPVAPDSYRVEYWVTGDCAHPNEPLLSTGVLVSPKPQPVVTTTWGLIKALYQRMLSDP